MGFPERLKSLRLEKKLTQEELGNKLNVTKANISKYETGRIEPNIETLDYLSNFFDVSIDYLLGKTDKRDSDKQDLLPEEFTSPEEAVKFLLEQNVIMGFGGFDVNKMSDEKVVQFANEVLTHIRLLSYKYKSKGD
ncbi:helix-turn-helix domain-containing protein [Senegalia massiliensis]|uniref:helix-turn-helix domain-containing protein n=1 Tax=Senegalia massiliensis TaxID=1720316 RepID=UPI001FACF392|nr:helix-turn-helix transcriptional regulator [Senegalia massiliensis]